MKKKKKRLQKLMDEVSTDELESSESEPFSSDDDVRDPTYQTSSSEDWSENETRTTTATTSTRLMLSKKNQRRFHSDVVNTENDKARNPLSETEDVQNLSGMEQDMQEPGNETHNLSDVSERETDNEWCDVIADIPDFAFDDSLNSLNLIFEKDHPTAKDFFFKFWDQELMELILLSMNNYVQILNKTNLPKQKYSRHASIRPFRIEELNFF